MKDEQIIKVLIEALQSIIETCDHLNTGNVSHQKNVIVGMAKRSIEFKEKYYINKEEIE